MTITLDIPCKPFSVNAMYGKKRFKTTQARDWSYQVFHILNKIENTRKMASFRNSFDPQTMAIEVCLTFYFPKDILITKSGMISGRAFDVSNMEKCIIDLIFDKKYFDKDPPYGCENLCLDDKYIISMNSKKRIGDDFLMKVELNTVPLENVY